MNEEIPRLLAVAGLELNAGHTAAALEAFSAAADHLGKDVTYNIQQMRGVCLRMLAANSDGDYAKAHAAFKAAWKLSASKFEAAKILRDWAMIDMVQGKYGHALDQFRHAVDLLEPDPSSSVQSAEREIEQAVTLGFCGRAHWRLGNINQARSCFRTAGSKLIGRSPYELNNLVWQMKVELLWRRICLASRGLRLARATRVKAQGAISAPPHGFMRRIKYHIDARKREIQIILLVICRPLAIKIGG